MIDLGVWEWLGIWFFAFAFLTGLWRVIRAHRGAKDVNVLRPGNPVEFNEGSDENPTDHQRSRR